jgi:putative transposase
MPARNVRKQYAKNSYYHLYNRGVEKRVIFLDAQDYGVFLGYLKQYLLPKDEKMIQKRLTDPIISSKEKDHLLKQLRLNNFADEITLLAYCLKPNHFHFFVKQNHATAIDAFMQSLCTRYTMYFNHRYKRVGSLFQGVYKAVMITTDEQFLHLSRYIHKQALTFQGETLEPQENNPSSYREYIGLRKSIWVHPKDVLDYFTTKNPLLSYENFVAQEENPHILSKITLE